MKWIRRRGVPGARRVLVVCSLALALVLAAGRTAAAVEATSPGASTATTVGLPGGPGSIAGLGGEADVALFSGQVQYEVGFDLPDGPAGLAPSLSLHYHGELGNGVAGVGWTLGVPRIQRSTREGRPGYDAEDELEISGLANGRLVAVGGGRYHVEGTGTRFRVERTGARWVVTDPSGTRWWFGRTQASRLQDDGGQVAEWWLETVIHPTGHAIDFSYERDQDQLYLSAVRWGADRELSLEFAYETRPDPVISWLRGFEVVTAWRLSTATVRSTERVLRTYRVGYATLPEIALSRVERIEMTGLDGAGAMPTLTFAYAPRTQAPLASRDVGAWVLGQRGVVLVDLDGDGAGDLVRLETPSPSWRRNLGTRFDEARSLPGLAVDLADAHLLDLDGDSRPELVRIVDDAWRVSSLRPGAGGWGPPSEWTGTRGVPLAGADLALADLDGDGRTDVVRASTDGLRWWRSTGHALAAPTSLGPISTANPEIVPGRPGVRLLDLNGDGLADVAAIADDGVRVLLGRGDGSFAGWRRFFWPWGAGAIDPRDVVLGDLDRDGLVDLIRFTLGHVYWFAGRADGTWAATPTRVSRPEAADADVVVDLADGNGNGSTDLVWSSPRGLWVLDLAGPTSAGMVAAIDSGLGKVTRFEYRTSFELALEDEARGRPWAHHAGVALPVATAIELDLGDGAAPRRTEHRVRDALWDVEDRRFGGFLAAERAVIGEGPGDTARVELRFHAGLGEERVLRGESVGQTLRDGADRVVVEVVETRIAHPVAGLEAYPRLRVPVLREIQTLHHEGVTRPIERRSLWLVDGEGRAVEEHHVGRLDVVGDELVVQRRFVRRDDTTWIGGDLVCEESTLDRDGVVVARAQTVYGDETADAALCEPGEGLVRLRRDWLAEEGRWVTVERTERYTAAWNPVDVYRGGIQRRYTYDAADLHVETESVSPAAGVTLTWQVAWDLARGLPISTRDPSGVELVSAYDALGRVTSVARGDAEPHVRYVHDWRGPTPSTETWTYGGADDTLAGSWTGTWSPTTPWRQQVTIHDAAGQVLRAAVRLDAATWIIEGDTQRDRKGRRVAVVSRYFWTGDPRAAEPPAGHPAEQLAYDALDRLIVRRRPDGAVQRTRHRAYAEEVTLDGLAPVTTERDGHDRVTRTERTVGAVIETSASRYDAMGRLVELSLQGGAAVHRFDYDTLGRLRLADDPDVGERRYEYLDGGQLASSRNGADETVGYAYDGAGRLTEVTAAAVRYRYHYDVARDPAAFPYTASRLAWIEEPTGVVELGYDGLGRQARLRRAIRDVAGGAERIAEERATLAANGALLRLRYDDGFDVAFTHDGAGRLIRAGDYWILEAQDAAGRALRERFGNGAVQHTSFDDDGRPEWVQVERPRAGALERIYEVGVTRTPFGAIASVADVDDVGLDHGAAFSYDGAGRLIDATIGTPGSTGAAAPYAFRYRFDGLQNLIERGASGPTSLEVVAGDYRYGGLDELGRTAGPRQLTEIRAPGAGAATGDVLARFAYDAAGRQVRARGRTLTYNGLDQLVRVDLPDGRSVEHAYGYNGHRVITQSADGGVRYWFSEGITEADGVREHILYVGDRPVVRVALAQVPGGGAAPGATAGGVGRAGFVVLAALAGLMVAAALGLALGRAARSRRAVARPVLAAIAASSLLTSLAGCDFRTAALQQPVWRFLEARFYHATISAGPSLITRGDGTILEERRFEPFGVAIDAWREGAAGAELGAVDYDVDPQNILNKRSDADTGWSYHGARWMAPETAAWLTPDPPARLPDPAYAQSFWQLHPYQYADQNPVAFWDPDGNTPDGIEADEPTDLEDGPRLFELEQVDETYTDYETVNETTKERGGVGGVVMGLSLATAGGLVADDATVVGVADDVLIPVALTAAAIGWLMSSSKTVTRTRTIPRVKVRRITQLKPLVWVTYTKFNPTTGETYVGRTSGYGDPYSVVRMRDVGHHRTPQGFGPAQLDVWAPSTSPARMLDVGYFAIRGREQQLIDFYGGSWSDAGGRGKTTSGNAIRGVGKANPAGLLYHNAATSLFGEAHPYTGNY